MHCIIIHIRRLRMWSADNEIGGEKKVVNPGDSMLKKDGVEHGCVCLEEGILLDIFAPMREDFVS